MSVASPKQHVSRNALFYRSEKELEDARRLRGWAAFHRLCGEHWLYFDDIEKLGRRNWNAVAYTIKGRALVRRAILLATGNGATVISALADAYTNSGIAIDGADALLDRLRGIQSSTQTAQFSEAKVTEPMVQSSTFDDEDLIG